MGPLRGRASGSRGHSVPREPPSRACPSTSSPRCACCSRGPRRRRAGKGATLYCRRPTRSPLGTQDGPPQPGDRPPRPPSPPSGREGTTWATRLFCLAADLRESGFLPGPGPSPGRWARVSPFPEGARNCQALSPHKFRVSREPLGPRSRGAAAGFRGAPPRAVGDEPGSPSPHVGGGFEKCLENVAYVCGPQHCSCQSVFLTPFSTDFLKSPHLRARIDGQSAPRAGSERVGAAPGRGV